MRLLRQKQEENCCCWCSMLANKKIQKGIRNFRTEGTTATNLEVWFGKNVEAKVEFLAFVRT
jgi:hypothetical protein